MTALTGAELAELSDAEVQSATDRMTASLFLIADDDERRMEWPETVRSIEAEIERRVVERVQACAARPNGRIVNR